MAKNTLSIRDEQKQRTRQRLLDAAAEVFEEQGFFTASIDAIVERAGVSRPTFYQYFKNKTQALSALVLEEEIEADLYVQQLPVDASKQQLRAWLDGLLALYERSQATMLAWTQAESLDAEFRTITRGVQARWIDEITSHLIGARKADQRCRTRTVAAESDAPPRATGALHVHVVRARPRHRPRRDRDAAD